MRDPFTLFVVLVICLCSSSCMVLIIAGIDSALNDPLGSASDVFSGAARGFGNVVSGGDPEFSSGFEKGVTDPVGAADALINLAQGRNAGANLQQADKCQILCGGSQGCAKGKQDVSSGVMLTLPQQQQDVWAWCSGVPTETMPTTSKDQLGSACCP